MLLKAQDNIKNLTESKGNSISTIWFPVYASLLLTGYPVPIFFFIQMLPQYVLYPEPDEIHSNWGLIPGNQLIESLQWLPIALETKPMGFAPFFPQSPWPGLLSLVLCPP